jgi:hypothetical protein
VNEVCANCDCQLGADCCGDGTPFELDGIKYCCQSCAEDGVCACGCVATGATAPAEAPAVSGF